MRKTATILLLILFFSAGSAGAVLFLNPPELGFIAGIALLIILIVLLAVTAAFPRKNAKSAEGNDLIVPFSVLAAIFCILLFFLEEHPGNKDLGDGIYNFMLMTCFRAMLLALLVSGTVIIGAQYKKFHKIYGWKIMCFLLLCIVAIMLCGYRGIFY